MRTVCKCHGLSGSCALKTCWRKMSPLDQVGTRLMERYDAAVHVMVSNENGAKMAPVAGRTFRTHGPEDLVYSTVSPDYCRRSKKVGSLGTRGRICNRTSIGVDGCEVLCCGRGSRSETVTVVENCRCKFRYCCEVTCQTCTHKTVITRCL